MFNKVFLIGNLTKDPELRPVEKGEKSTSVANFTVAVNRHFKRKDGTADKETTYVDCELWDTGAENFKKLCGLGDPVALEGSLKLDKWEDKESGGKRSKLKIRVQNFQKLWRKPKDDQAVEDTKPKAETVVATPEGDEGDDIPF